MVLGDDGIISQAQDAKKAQQESEDTQAIKLATGEAATSEHLGVLTASEVKKQSRDTIEFTEANPYNNSIREILEFDGKDGEKQYLPIPKGMAYAYGTIDEGAVVVDSYGNEFVWVPVDEVKASGTANYEDEYVWLVHNENDTKDQPKEGEVPTGVATDYEAMKKSVSLYGGFYVGRYETSWTGSRVASVPNVTSFNARVGEIEATWYTFYTEQKKLHENSDSVVSGMIYGSQWDAIMDWMSEEKNIEDNTKYYINYSIGMGNYHHGEESEPIKTGSNLAYSVKNIFDLAGNYWDWTQEASGNTDRVLRGGYYWHGYPGNSASCRLTCCPGCIDDYTSRLQLYIK